MGDSEVRRTTVDEHSGVILLYFVGAKVCLAARWPTRLFFQFLWCHEWNDTCCTCVPSHPPERFCEAFHRCWKSEHMCSSEFNKKPRHLSIKMFVIFDFKSVLFFSTNQWWIGKKQNIGLYRNQKWIKWSPKCSITVSLDKISPQVAWVQITIKNFWKNITTKYSTYLVRWRMLLGGLGIPVEQMAMSLQCTSKWMGSRMRGTWMRFQNMTFQSCFTGWYLQI